MCVCVCKCVWCVCVVVCGCVGGCGCRDMYECVVYFGYGMCRSVFLRVHA